MNDNVALIDALLANWQTNIIIIIFAMWGGTVKYVNILKRNNNSKFSITQLLYQWIVGGFAGILTGHLMFAIHAQSKLNNSFLLFCAGISGYMGPRMLTILEEICVKFFKRG